MGQGATAGHMNQMEVVTEMSNHGNDDERRLTEKLKEDKVRSYEEKLKTPLKDIGFERAASIIGKLQEIRGLLNFDDSLKLAECEIHLHRGREKDAIKGVQYILCMLQPNCLGAWDIWHTPKATSQLFFPRKVRDLGYVEWREGNTVRALILYRLAHEFSKTKSVPPNERLRWIANRFTDIGNLIKALIEEGGSYKFIAEAYGFQWMVELVVEFRGIDGDPAVVAQMMANCMVEMTDAANNFKRFRESRKFGEYGVTVLEFCFQSQAIRVPQYGLLLNNIGNACYELGHLFEAEDFYIAAILVKEDCKSFETKKIKKESIAVSERNLKRTLDLLKSIYLQIFPENEPVLLNET